MGYELLIRLRSGEQGGHNMRRILIFYKLVIDYAVPAQTFPCFHNDFT